MMTDNKILLNFAPIHPSWQPLFNDCLATVSPEYLAELETKTDWLPGRDMIFNAFSKPLPETKMILFGESPYPRASSANGYAFWDSAVDGLWSEQGLSRAVNRATSLRNFIKMLLVADGLLSPRDTTQQTIANLAKDNLVQEIDELFTNMLDAGFLLLNTSLVLSDKPVRVDAKAWLPFMHQLLIGLKEYNPDLTLILFGQIAKKLAAFPIENYKIFACEHPYNVSFITNEDVIQFFKPFHLLETK